MLHRSTLAVLVVGAIVGLGATSALAQPKPPVTVKTKPADDKKTEAQATEEKITLMRSELETLIQQSAQEQGKSITANAERLALVAGQIDEQQERLDTQQQYIQELNDRVALLEGQFDDEPSEEPEPGEMVDEFPFELSFSGFVRVTYQIVQDDTERTDFVGLNDGFILNNARLNVEGTYEDIGFLLQFDGAVSAANDRNTADLALETGIQDALIFYRPFPWLQARVGRLRPPFDVESIQDRNEIYFIQRSVAARGVTAVEGINVDGLGQARQVGLMLHSERLMTESGLLGFGWFAAATNGNDGSSVLNDNDALAGYARLELYYRDWITLGFSGLYNTRTTNIAPDLIDEEQIGFNADLSFDVYGVIGGLQYTQLNTSFPDVSVEADRKGLGYYGWLGYRLPYGIAPAVRYAFYDPIAEYESSDDVINSQLQSDELTYITPALTWDVPQRPIRLQANYTFTLEGEGRELNNDRFELLAQLEF